uniref:Virulence plasmid B protein n=1 Tax=Candidatus Kentrum sp. UNK TaxID=2126344 RepID=A0A451AQG9_9GAMM|nr:MAG: virulence plasmid B protein [Candidatus Kentron sp. UNK]VFK73512.1 MAG: virulence plasmid B protein [Candidatus Kentron sp. UNK]
MQPDLAITYNSNGGNGLLGVGFSLSGLSVITRCGQTIAQDGRKGGIYYDARDRFCLDGQRLIAISGTDGGDGTEYRTEIDGYSKVVSHGQQGIGPAWWRVRTKSGQVMEFGNTADSRIEAQGKDTVRLWAVTGRCARQLPIFMRVGRHSGVCGGPFPSFGACSRTIKDANPTSRRAFRNVRFAFRHPGHAFPMVGKASS